MFRLRSHVNCARHESISLPTEKAGGHKISQKQNGFHSIWMFVGDAKIHVVKHHGPAVAVAQAIVSKIATGQ